MGLVQQRLAGVERSDAGKGLRNKLEKMRIRVTDLERQMADLIATTTEDESEAQPVAEEKDWDAELADWKEDLREGIPVHVDGLQGRPELNTKAGFLGEWHADRGRWRVRVGTEDLLLKPANVFP